jgi:hypothetical protein
MGCFSDVPDVYRRVGRLIENALSDPMSGDSLALVDAIVQYRLRAPVCTITVDARAGSEPVVLYGESDLVPDIVLSADAEVAELLWQRELDLTIALARDELSATGPVEQLLAAVAVAPCETVAR